MADPSQPAPDQFDTQLQGLLAPPKPTGLADKASALFAHPLVQAALGAYLGGITTPRYEGIGGLIGHAGLTGLQDFNQARQMQLQQPLMRTEMLKNIVGAKESLAKAGQATAQAGLVKAETGQYASEPELANHLDVLAKNSQDPATAMAYGVVAKGLRSGMKVTDAGKLLVSIAEEGPKVALQKAQTQMDIATGKLRGEQAAEAPQLAAALEGQRKASANLSNVRAESPPGTPTQQQTEQRRMAAERQANTEASEAYTHLLSTYWVKGHTPEREAWVKNYKDQRFKELMANAEGTDGDSSIASKKDPFSAAEMAAHPNRKAVHGPDGRVIGFRDD